MLQLFPFLGWLALVTSVVLLIVLFWLGELSPRALVLLVAWWVIAAYGEFYGGTAIVSAAGRGLQTVLAVHLIMRWRFSGV